MGLRDLLLARPSKSDDALMGAVREHRLAHLHLHPAEREPDPPREPRQPEDQRPRRRDAMGLLNEKELTKVLEP